jgi:hypothetical protein
MRSKSGTVVQQIRLVSGVMEGSNGPSKIVLVIGIYLQCDMGA